MSEYVKEALNQIRSEIAPADAVLKEARERRDLVRDLGMQFGGVAGTFVSGSLAHGTANKPLSDADCGLVLDRRSHPDLGPDGNDVGPGEVVENVRQLLGDGVREAYPDARLRVNKRSITVIFDPVDAAQGPSVDLVVAVNRKDAPGLWIPNTEQGRWDASDPAAHTSMIVTASKNTGSTLARAIRLAKAWNAQFSTPAICSFNIEALALSAINQERDLVKAVPELFEHAATDLALHRTPDPAGVSGPIKFPPGMDKDRAVGRISRAASHMRAAVEADEGGNEEGAQEELTKVFPDYEELLRSAAIATALRQSRGSVSAMVPVRGRPATEMKNPRAWGLVRR